MARSRPNWIILRIMQSYSTRGWVYREEQGWIFAELTPDELAEFKSYKLGITIPRMRVRLPHYMATSFPWFDPLEPNKYVHWFAHCTMPQTHPLAQSRFHIHQVTDDRCETWLWADQVKFCREVGCEVTIHYTFGWTERQWRVSAEWRPPLQFKDRIFIYALVNEHTRQVYIGQTKHLGRRLAEHLRDTKHSGKVALIQSLRAQGCEPALLELEEVAGEQAIDRERYWISTYKAQGYNIINQDHSSLSQPDEESAQKSPMNTYRYVPHC